MPNPKRPAYPAEFRAEAARLARSPGRTVVGVARDLVVARESVRRRARQAEIAAGRADGLTTEEREEVRTLRPRGHPGETGERDPVAWAALIEP